MRKATLLLTLVLAITVISALISNAFAQDQSLNPQMRQNLQDMSALMENISKQLSTGKMSMDAKKTAALIVDSKNAALPKGETFQFPCSLTNSPLQLWHHLAVKLILNTLSTATMVRMDRVIGNAMVWLSPSNKKLIDRGSRLISQQMDCSYEQACIILHEAMEEVQSAQQQGKDVPSPVALAIKKLRDKRGKS